MLKRYSFRAAPNATRFLKKHFSAVSLANNHSSEFGPEGLVEQLHILADNGIASFDAGRPGLAGLHPLVLIRASENRSIRCVPRADDEFGRPNPLLALWAWMRTEPPTPHAHANPTRQVESEASVPSQARSVIDGRIVAQAVGCHRSRVGGPTSVTRSADVVKYWDDSTCTGTQRLPFHVSSRPPCTLSTMNRMTFPSASRAPVAATRSAWEISFATEAGPASEPVAASAGRSGFGVTTIGTSLRTVALPSDASTSSVTGAVASGAVV